MDVKISITERNMIAIYRGVNAKGKKYILDMLDIVSHHYMKSNESSNICDMEKYRNRK